MKAALLFSLPEEREDHDCALRGWEYKAVLREFDELLRGEIKYKKKKSMSLYAIRSHLWKMISDRGLEME